MSLAFSAIMALTQDVAAPYICEIAPVNPNPERYVELNGQIVAIADFQDLYDEIGQSYGDPFDFVWAPVSQEFNGELRMAKWNAAASRIYVGGQVSLAYSENGTEWFTELGPGSIPLPVVGSAAGFFFAADNDEIYEHNGSAWAFAGNGPSQVFGFAKIGSRIVAIGDGGGLSSVIGGAWSFTSPFLTTLVLNAISSNEMFGVVVGEGGEIHRSTNATTWAAVTNPNIDDLRCVHVVGSVVIAAGENGSILRSQDDGQTFTEVARIAGVGTFTGISRGSVFGNLVWIAITDQGKVFFSADEGLNWNQSTDLSARFKPQGNQVMDYIAGNFYIPGFDWATSKSVVLRISASSVGYDPQTHFKLPNLQPPGGAGFLKYFMRRP